MVPLPRYFGTRSLPFKGIKHTSTLFIESVSYIFISILYHNNYNAYDIGIKYKNCKRTVTYQFQNEDLNSVIINFVLNFVIHNVGL